MVMDFADMSKVVDREIISKWDHQFLNDLVPFVTTAENLASHIFTTLRDAGLSVTKIKLRETAKCFVEITA
jgi:6-pyruvoyltetrahydropterin/6-carboxytetrahydropterin synthase